MDIILTKHANSKNKNKIIINFFVIKISLVYREYRELVKG